MELGISSIIDTEETTKLLVGGAEGDDNGLKVVLKQASDSKSADAEAAILVHMLMQHDLSIGSWSICELDPL